MSAEARRDRRTRGRVGRRGLIVAGLAAAALAAAALAIPEAPGGPPLDPRSASPDGTRALTELLDGLGAQVRPVRTTPAAGVETALVLSDRLEEAERAALTDWVREGGRLVVADPWSPLTPAPQRGSLLVGMETRLRRGCAVPALAAVEEVAAPGGASFAPGEAAVGCFGRGDGHWLVVEPLGAGTRIALAGPAALTNRWLGEADNAALAAALLAPEAPEGRPQVAVVAPPLPGEGEAGLLDLVPEVVWAALAQLAFALLLVLLWRARRLGRPVDDPPQVRLLGAELVAAVGDLRHSARAREQAAATLRADAAAALRRRHGIPAGAGAETLAPLVAAHSARSPDEVVELLDGPAPDSEAALISLAQELAELVARAPGAGAGEPRGAGAALTPAGLR